MNKNIKYLCFLISIEYIRYLPQAYLDCRKPHGPCHNSKNIGRENINYWPAIRKMFSVYPHRRSDKLPWLSSVYDRRLASHDESPIICPVNDFGSSGSNDNGKQMHTQSGRFVWKINERKWTSTKIQTKSFCLLANYTRHRWCVCVRRHRPEGSFKRIGIKDSNWRTHHSIFALGKR